MRQFLGDISVSSLMNTRPLVEASSTDTIEQGLTILRTCAISSLPIYDTLSRMYVGMVDALDLAAFVVSSYTRLQAHAQADDADLVVVFGQQLGDVMNMSQANYMAPVLDSASLLEAAENYLQNGWHRVLVVSSDLPSSRRMQDVLGMVTQSDLVATLHESTASAVQAFKCRTLLELGVVEPEFQIGVASVTLQHTLLQALELMLENSYSGIAVVDDAGKIVNCVSASDVKGISKDNFSMLSTPLGELLDSGKKLPVVKMRPYATLGECMAKFVSTGVHRIFLVDDEDIPIDVLTLTDLIRIIMSPR